MKITRLNKIKDHRIFSGFSWPGDLPDFARFNLIYGWNGAGKTTLSNLFRCMERRESIAEGEVEFHLDGNACDGATFGSSNILPQVRVFNRSFIEASVFSVTQQITPIFFLGKDSAEKQKQVEEAKALRAKEQEKLERNTAAGVKADKALDDFCIAEAKAIKELLSSSGTNPYNNYDKARFKKGCAKFAKVDPPPAVLDDAEKLFLKQKKDATSKEGIMLLTPIDCDFTVLEATAEKLLAKTVVSQVMAELQADADVAEWVETGLGLHTGEKHSDQCRFCSSQIPAGRVTQLEAHFNDQYKSFLSELDAAISTLEDLEKEYEGLELPDKARIHEHLSGEYVVAAKETRKHIKDAKAYLAAIIAALKDKRTKPFQALSLKILIPKLSVPGGDNTEVFNKIHDVIALHNAATENFQAVVSEARTKLEEGLIAEALGDFKAKTEAISALEREMISLKAAIKSFDDTIAALEREVSEHRRPADELNDELRSYLGRDELKFAMSGNGYEIARNGITATDLSEGERSAIAFLYFLKSLHAKDFNLVTDIVVIDDPVSSLDANSLFCAFGYMRECTKEAGQLFILTHNFAFFRQIKNWFNHSNKGKKDPVKPARFYMVESTIASGKRNAALKQLDPLLHQFESEYHYLFKKIHDEAGDGTKGRGLDEYYSMPNIARRALESFMAFRYPAESGKLTQQLELVAFDAAKKARILRFLHTYSHDGKIAEPEHDLSVLAETPQILQDILDLIRAEDSKHYAEMEKLVSPPAA